MRSVGEHCVAVLGCAGTVGASTVALAIGLATAAPVRVVECCSVTASGLAAASSAELGLHPTGWSQGRRGRVLLERASEILVGAGGVPLPTRAERETQLTVLDVGWEAGLLLSTDCWLAEAVRTADQIVLVTTATVPGMRRVSTTLELLADHWQPERVALAVRGRRRGRWSRGVEQAGGPAVRRVLDAGQCVEIPEDRGLAVSGLDSNPFPAAVVRAARQFLDPTQLRADDVA